MTIGQILHGLAGFDPTGEVIPSFRGCARAEYERTFREILRIQHVAGKAAFDITDEARRDIEGNEFVDAAQARNGIVRLICP